VRTVRFYNLSPITVLAAVELLIFSLTSLLVSYAASGGASWRLDRWEALRLLGFGVTMSLSMIAMGLYHRRQRAALPGIVIRVAVAAVGGGAVVGLLSYLLPRVRIDRGALAAALLLSIVLVCIARALFERLASEDLFRRRVLVLGCGRRAENISKLRRRSDLRDFLVVGFAPVAGEQPAVPQPRILDIRTSLLDCCRVYQVDEIVVAMDDRRQRFPVYELLECRVHGVEVTEVVDFLERETGKVRLDVLNPSWIIFSPGFSRGAARAFASRALDVIASLMILALAWPVMLLTALAVKLEDGLRAPVLYRQLRVGLEGRHFEVLKFRSMRVDAEANGAQWALQRDPRVSRVGSVIRKLRIDELPQIINVLAGDMRFVGPRPERPEFVAAFEEKIPYYRERHYVKPGITGWAQLCYPYGASEQDAALKLEYDPYYVKNRSLVFDLMILLQTVEVVLWGKGGR